MSNSYRVYASIQEVEDKINSSVDSEVTAEGTKSVSGAAVVAYVAEQIAAITNYEEVAF